MKRSASISCVIPSPTITPTDFVLQNQFGSNIVSLLGYFVVNSIILPAALLPTLMCLSIYGYIFVRYLRVSRELNRISSTTTAPIFSGFEQVLTGITTVRAFERQNDYREALFELLDSSQALSVHYPS